MITATPYSDLKILRHTDKLKSFIENKRTAPIYVRIKPTNVCNQSCSYCAYAADAIVEGREIRSSDFIPWLKMQEIIQDIHEMKVKAITFSGGGDPLCYPYIKETLKMVVEKKIDFSIITNGQALDKVFEEAIFAKWIRISLDSANTITYKKIRSVDTFNKVIDNIKQFSKIKPIECELGINYVVTKDNFDQIIDFCELANSIGVNNVKFSPQISKNDFLDYHKNFKDKAIAQLNIAKEKFRDSNLNIIDKYQSDLEFTPMVARPCEKCHITNFFTVIAANCKIYSCHQKSYQEDAEIGDLTKNSFKDTWFSEQTMNKTEQFNPQEHCKNVCVFDERNKLLEAILGIDENHVNFI